MTDLLFGSVRLRFSEAQKKAVLSWAREMGAQNVPTLYALRKCQDVIRSRVGNPTCKVTASSGNVFYINSIGSAIAMVCVLVTLLTQAVATDPPAGLFKPSYSFLHA
jgi:hypothetical protein